MNIFEKYIANVQENEQLSKKIDKLCYAYLFSENDISERIRNKRFVKFIHKYYVIMPFKFEA